MKYTSLQFSDVEWEISPLSEDALLLRVLGDVPIEQIHQASHAIEVTLGEYLKDIVPAYDSIAIFSDQPFEDVIWKLAATGTQTSPSSFTTDQLEIPICYELGLDVEDICKHANLTIEEVIERHLQATYRSLFIGFTPGFVYADGLDPVLTCPRKTSPRTHIAAGSVGIGGTQTGIYSLNSPGGWNIIGQTPLMLFDPTRQPPMAIGVGTSFRFRRISEKEFQAWES